jgi:hypothetical protein
VNRFGSGKKVQFGANIEPSRLDGKPALVLDYAQGVPCKRLNPSPSYILPTTLAIDLVVSKDQSHEALPPHRTQRFGAAWPACAMKSVKLHRGC